MVSDDELKLAAQEQVNSGANPWLAALEQGAAKQGLTPAGPETVAGYDTFNKPGAVSVPGAAPVSMTKGAPLGMVQFPPGMMQTPAQKAAAMAPASAAGPSKPAGPSPERIDLAEEEAIRKEQMAALQEQHKGVRQQQEILQTGETIAQKQAQAAELMHQANEADIEQLRRETVSHANLRDIELNRDAELLRKEKPDPQHWYKEKGTAGSILAAIAIGAGAFAAAMPHTGNHENQALGIINKAIDRDVAAQEEDIANKWKALDWQGNQNQKEWVRDQWMLNQKTEAKRTAYDHAMAMVAQTRMGANNQAQAQGLDNLATQIQGEIAKLQTQGAQHRLHVAVQERTAAQAAAMKNQVSSKEITAKAFELMKDPNFQAPAGMSREEAAVRSAQAVLTGGKGGPGATVSKPGTAGKAEDNARAADEVIRINTEIKRILSNPTEANSMAGRAKLDELARAGALAYPRMHTGSTRINETEINMAKNAYKGAGGFLRGDVFGTNAATLDSITDMAKRLKASPGTGTEPSGEIPGAKEIED